jgi:saccharopine dehydrogenase-like NADP-dependent oxidoreductase
MKRVLILGAGLVAKPIVEYLMQNSFQVIIASPTKGRADEMIKGNPLGASVDWSTDDPDTLDLLAGNNDIVVSLLPYRYHADVARVCLKHRKPLVTTSYIQKEMEVLDADAKGAGVLFLNEAGLDPGIDHMSAMRLIDHIHGQGGKVEEFYSICGALPAPESADNPMRYKFSWSPKGVLIASLNGAQYLKDGKKVTVEPAALFRNTFEYHLGPVGTLEVYPNRDSISYAAVYGIPEAKTMYRGTFRYKGWCETIDAMKSLNLFDDSLTNFSGMTYAGFLAGQAGSGIAELKENIMLKAGNTAALSLDYLGFFDDEKLPYTETTPFEITSDRMVSRMMLAENDRDLVILHHVILASWPGGKKEVIRSSMIDYGSPATNTAIAKTVALPAAVAVKLILGGKITLTGVRRPVYPEIYNPITEELEILGIKMNEEFSLPVSEMNALAL